MNLFSFKTGKKMQQPKLLDLQNFDPNTVDPLGHILIHGKKKTGKSVLAGDFIYRITKLGDGRIKRIAVMSGTEKYNKAYEKQYKVSPDYIRNEFDEDFLTTIVKHQKKVAAEYGGDNPDRGILLILEDLAFEKEVFDHPLIKEIMYNGRWFNMSLLLIIQEPSACPKRYRNCLDIIATTRENMPAQQKNLYDHYFGMFDSLGAFVINLRHYTKNNNVLILTNTQNPESVEQCTFTYHAPYRKNGIIVKQDDPEHPEYREYMAAKRDKLLSGKEDEFFSYDDCKDEDKILEMKRKRLDKDLSSDFEDSDGEPIKPSKKHKKNSESDSDSDSGNESEKSEASTIGFSGEESESGMSSQGSNLVSDFDNSSDEEFEKKFYKNKKHSTDDDDDAKESFDVDLEDEKHIQASDDKYTYRNKASSSKSKNEPNFVDALDIVKQYVTPNEKIARKTIEENAEDFNENSGRKQVLFPQKDFKSLSDKALDFADS